MASILELEKICTQVRRDIVRMVHAVNSGHPGGSLGCTEYLVALYFETMAHNPSNFKMDGLGEDLFFLSNGHISPVFYSVLSRSGYFELNELHTFRKLNSRLQGHPTTHEGLPGVRIASGSLGQGLSVAIGAALAKKLNNDNNIIYSLHGDGELQEGQIWEAGMYAAGRKVDNIISTVDFNGQQIDGSTDQVLPLGDLKAKYIQAISGAAVSEQEAKRLSAIIPSDTDSEVEFEGKTRAMRNYLNTALKIKEAQGLGDVKEAFGALEKSGVSVDSFYKPKTVTDKYKFVDGVMKKVQ